MQLVERFAAALHEAQDAAPRDMAEAQGRQIKRDSQGEAERERALATALKALDMFVKDGFEAHGEAAKTRALRDASGETDAQDLRAALTKLQNVNGAA